MSRTLAEQTADLVIETLALSEAELRERIVELEADLMTFRELLHEAVHTLHVVTQRGERSLTTIIALTNTLRDARAQIADLRQQLAGLRRQSSETADAA